MYAPDISRAQKADIPQLLQLVNSAYRGEEAKKGWTHEADLIEGELRTDAQSLEEMMEKPGAVILKYVLDGKIRGCVYLEKQEKKLYLGMLSVSPEIQAQGIGKKLLQSAEAYARQNHCSYIEMTVISLRKELIAWYERNGYQNTSETKPFHDDGRFGNPVQPIHFIVMEKRL